jgi:hypothetical protein
MKSIFTYVFLLFSVVGAIQSLQTLNNELTGPELLEKAIQYHDPNGNWATFNGTLNITMETPKSANRESTININLPKEYFYMKATRDGKTTEYTIEKDNCTIAFNGSTDISTEVAKENDLSCESANLYKNYYTYLYGLPMKLKDEGTIIDPKVQRKAFKGKEYLVLKATYKEGVGIDIWYFYFDPKSYAMEVYQFFREEAKNDGEYILLTEEVVVNGIKMPKNRAWYYNKNDGYLGTDILK